MVGKKTLVLALFPLILSIGIAPAIPFADSQRYMDTIYRDDSMTECRQGLYLVYRIPNADYICTQDTTAQRWEQLGIAEIVSKGTIGEMLKETEDQIEEEILEEGLRVDIIPVKNNISMLIGVNGFSGGNVGVLAGDDGLLMIDDGLESVLDKITTQLEQLKTCETCGDVKFLVNTHWHADHVGGNSHFGEQGTVIVAHENLRKVLSSPQTLEYFNATYDTYPKEALPVITFEESVTLHFNEETIQVIHLPNGHTNNDSIIYFAESNVLHLGDIFFKGNFPFVDLDHGGSVIGLTNNIEEVLNKFPEETIVIPGHGELSTIQDVRMYHDMLVETTNIVREQISEGKSLGEIQNSEFPENWTLWESGRIDTPTWIEFIHTDLTRNSNP